MRGKNRRRRWLVWVICFGCLEVGICTGIYAGAFGGFDIEIGGEGENFGEEDETGDVSDEPIEEKPGDVSEEPGEQVEEQPGGASEKTVEEQPGAVPEESSKKQPVKAPESSAEKSVEESTKTAGTSTKEPVIKKTEETSKKPTVKKTEEASNGTAVKVPKKSSEETWVGEPEDDSKKQSVKKSETPSKEQSEKQSEKLPEQSSEEGTTENEEKKAEMAAEQKADKPQETIEKGVAGKASAETEGTSQQTAFGISGVGGVTAMLGTSRLSLQLKFYNNNDEKENKNEKIERNDNNTIAFKCLEQMREEKYPVIEINQTGSQVLTEDISILSLLLNGEEVSWHQEGNLLILDVPVKETENQVELIAVQNGWRILRMPVWEF